MTEEEKRKQVEDVYNRWEAWQEKMREELPSLVQRVYALRGKIITDRLETSLGRVMYKANSDLFYPYHEDLSKCIATSIGADLDYKMLIKGLEKEEEEHGTI